MQVREIMTSEIEGVPRDANLEVAAEKMKTLDVGALPVWDGSECVGIVTDRDIVVRAIAAGREPARTPVEAVMTPEIVFCYHDQDTAEAARLMADRQVRRLAVLDREDRLVGIVSLGDLALGGAESDVSGEALREISEPGRADVSPPPGGTS